MMMVNAKVLVCVVAGALYIMTAAAILRKAYRWILAGVIAFLLFDSLYAVERALWWRTYPNTWIGFGIFGALSLLFGVISWRYWQQKALDLNVTSSA